jgi:hypothetical protein
MVRLDARNIQPMSSDAKAVAASLAQAGHILDLIDDMCNEGYASYGRDVELSVKGVMETIKKNGRVSLKQQDALDGWQAGVEAWIPGER